MTILFRAVFALGLALAASFSLAPAAHACKCMFPPPEGARDNATAVFEGRVTSVQHQEATGAAGIGYNLVTLKLVRTWKGVNEQETVDVRTSDSSASCGVEFAKDTSYLVYAVQGEQGLEVNACGRTREMSAAAEDLAVLGGGVTPVKVEAPKPAEQPEPAKVKSGGCASSSKVSTGAIMPLILPVFGMVLIRRRRG